LVNVLSVENRTPEGEKDVFGGEENGQSENGAGSECEWRDKKTRPQF
jgi:hypothetical protein